MIHVFLASGEELLATPVEELSDARDLKKRLAPRCGVPRFRQRLLLNGTTLDDWALLDRAMDLQLVLLPHAEPTAEQSAALLAAAEMGSELEVLDILCDPGLHPDSARRSEHGGESRPLHLATRRGRISMVELLLEARADLDLPSGRLGETPLNIACFKGNLELVKVLLQASAGPDRSSGGLGVTPLHEACARGHLSVAKVLLEARAGVDKFSRRDGMSYGETPLYAAARAGHLEVSRLLLQFRADAEALCGLHGLTPLDAALSRNRVETWLLLLESRSVRTKLVGCCAKLRFQLLRRMWWSKHSKTKQH